METTDKTGALLIAYERERQILEEGYTFEHDDKHERGELAQAAAAYTLTDIFDESSMMPGTNVPALWPFDKRFWKPQPTDRISELKKAGALIAAEIDRLQRKKSEK